MSDQAENGRVKVSPSAIYVAVFVLGWLLTAFASYSAASSAMNARVSVLESQFQQVRQDLADIKADVRTLLQRGQP